MPRKLRLGRIRKNAENASSTRYQQDGKTKYKGWTKLLIIILYHYAVYYFFTVGRHSRSLYRNLFPSQWVDQSTSANDILVACKLQHTDGQSVAVTRSVTVNGDLIWCIHVHSQALDPTKRNALKIFPVTITTKAALNQLLTLVDTLNICAGHPDLHFLDLANSHKGKF